LAKDFVLIFNFFKKKRRKKFTPIIFFTIHSQKIHILYHINIFYNTLSCPIILFLSCLTHINLIYISCILYIGGLFGKVKKISPPLFTYSKNNQLQNILTLYYINNFFYYLNKKNSLQNKILSLFYTKFFTTLTKQAHKPDLIRRLVRDLE
jgi:hypothetical protein